MLDDPVAIHAIVSDDSGRSATLWAAEWVGFQLGRVAGVVVLDAQTINAEEIDAPFAAVKELGAGFLDPVVRKPDRILRGLEVLIVDLQVTFENQRLDEG